MSVEVASSGLLPLVERGLYDTLPQRGIIHVGANDGAEIDWYIDRGLSPVLCLEPNPAALRRGEERWHDEESVSFVGLALGAEDYWLDLYVPADGDDEKTSRYLAVPTPGHDWTSVPAADTIRAMQVRFDGLMQSMPINLSQFGTLVVDVQGMELEVLEGFGVYLQAFRYLCVELSESPMYDGEAPAAEVIKFLAERGFRQETPVEPHNDVCFSRI